MSTISRCCKTLGGCYHLVGVQSTTILQNISCGSNNINKEPLRQNRMQIDNWSSPAVSIHPSSSSRRKNWGNCASTLICRAHRTCQDPIRWKIPHRPIEKDFLICAWWLAFSVYSIYQLLRGYHLKTGDENSR